MPSDGITRIQVGDVTPDWGRLLILYDPALLGTSYTEDELADLSANGWNVGNELVIWKWDDEGGFTKVSGPDMSGFFWWW
jgi:hypothetical protein